MAMTSCWIQISTHGCLRSIWHHRSRPILPWTTTSSLTWSLIFSTWLESGDPWKRNRIWRQASRSSIPSIRTTIKWAAISAIRWRMDRRGPMWTHLMVGVSTTPWSSRACRIATQMWVVRPICSTRISREGTTCAAAQSHHPMDSRMPTRTIWTIGIREVVTMALSSTPVPWRETKRSTIMMVWRYPSSSASPKSPPSIDSFYWRLSVSLRGTRGWTLRGFSPHQVAPVTTSFSAQ